jgi:hypothetical protein
LRSADSSGKVQAIARPARPAGCFAQEGSIRGIGTASIAKSSIAISAAFILASAMAILLPAEASAQINIDGLIRGALQQRGGYPYGYRAPTHHASPSHSDSDDDSAADSKNGKGVKSTNDGADSNNKSSTGSGGPQSASSDAPSKAGPSGGSGSGGGGGGGSSGSGGPPKTSDDMPSFAPSR